MRSHLPSYHARVGSSPIDRERLWSTKLGHSIEHVARHCQVADERAFFSLGAERPSLGQQAHVTSSH